MAPLFSSLHLNNLEDLFLHDLDDLYDAEKQVLEALPKMADAASSPELKLAFMTHLDETKHQISRLEQCFRRLGREPDGTTCDGMKGIISECDVILDAKGDRDVRDAGLIEWRQKVEHYEMAGYGTVRTFAEHLGHSDVAEILQTTLDEEGQTDQMLTDLAQRAVNVRAEHS